MPGLFLPISDFFNCMEKPSDVQDGGFPKGEKLSGRRVRDGHRVDVNSDLFIELDAKITNICWVDASEDGIVELDCALHPVGSFEFGKCA